MVKYNVRFEEEDSLDRDPPDIFRAALNDDAVEMALAISAGQKLDDFDAKGAATSIHLACAHKSVAFLRAAMEHKFNPWIRDRNRRLAMDHAVANRLTEIQKALFQKMYEEEWQIDNLASLSAFPPPAPE